MTGVRPAHHADNLDRARDLAGGPRGGVLARLGNEAAIDDHEAAVEKPRRREDPITGAGDVGAKGRGRRVNERLLAVIEGGGECDAAVFVARRIEARPGRRRRQRRGRRRQPLGHCGDQSLFPGLALDLPGAERNENGEHEQCRDEQTEPRPPLLLLWPARSRSFSAEASFRGLVMILQRDQQSLHRPQRPERDDEDQRQPQRRVHPERRPIEHLGDEG